MSIYYSILTLLFIGCIIELCFFSKKHLGLYCFVGGVLTLWAALRYEVGGDWKNYMMFFEDQSAFEYEKGYFLLNRFFRLFTDDYYVFQFFCSLIPCSILFWHFYKQNKYPLFCLLIYFSHYYVWCNFEQIRQLIAYSIVALGFVFIERKNIYCWMLCVLLACQFHITSLIAFPLYFTSRIIFTPNSAFVVLAIAYTLNFINSDYLNVLLQRMLNFAGGEYLLLKSGSYLENLSTSNRNSLIGTTIRYLFYLVLLLCYKYRGDKSKNYYVCNFLIGVMFASMANTLEILNRCSIFYLVAGNGLRMFELFVTSVKKKPILDLVRRGCLVLFILFMCASFIKSILFLPEEVYSKLVPYKSILFR